MSSKTYSNVSPACWNCVQQTSIKQNGTVYDPPAPSNAGTATTSTPVGDVQLRFDYQPSAQTVTYTIVKKPWVVPESEIWNGIASTINGCNSN